jgi:hypothetical protein
MSYQNQNFKKLKAHWDKVLKESGFKDIEAGNGNFSSFSTHTKLSSFTPEGLGRFMEKVAHSGLTSREEYYRFAGFFLHDYQFKTTRDKEIWEAHANGDTYREISERMTKEGKGITFPRVYQIVQALKKEMISMYKGSNNEQT